MQRQIKIEMKTHIYVRYKCSLEKGESSFKEKRIAVKINTLIKEVRIRFLRTLTIWVILLIE